MKKNQNPDAVTNLDYKTLCTILITCCVCLISLSMGLHSKNTDLLIKVQEKESLIQQKESEIFTLKNEALYKNSDYENKISNLKTELVLQYQGVSANDFEHKPKSNWTIRSTKNEAATSIANLKIPDSQNLNKEEPDSTTSQPRDFSKGEKAVGTRNK